VAAASEAAAIMAVMVNMATRVRPTVRTVSTTIPSCRLEQAAAPVLQIVLLHATVTTKTGAVYIHIKKLFWKENNNMPH
jgi:hypothetical protein